MWFEKVCVVGLGAHARTKLIPALEVNGQEIAAVVSSQTGDPWRRFARLEDAVVALPKDVVFLVASPPAVHAAQARTILDSGHDLILEKPAFATEADTAELCALAQARGAVLLEAFMYRYTDAYARLLDHWRAGGIAALESKFLIPDVRGGTFREGQDIASSSLFDIGCYPISLLTDLGLDPKLELSEIHHAGIIDHERLRLQNASGPVAIDIEIGRGGAYENWVRLTGRDGAVFQLAPFFYGRKGDKTLSGAQSEVFADANAFERMFSLGRAELLAGQPARFARMIAAAAALEALGRDLEVARYSNAEKIR